LQIEKYHATVSINTEGDTHLQADRLHLLSVVFNLLDNALKYGNGNTAIKFDLKEKEKEIELSVADNGIGISQEYKDKVFEKFFRVPLGNTHNTKGYGLGLSYVVTCYSKTQRKNRGGKSTGLGSKFIITLPRRSLNYSQKNMSKTKVLYVEDELFLGKIVKESLESRGFEVIMESDGQKQQEHLKK
jgi:two-component system phosphate regulon sensor histidine kinase PhoR